MPIASVFSRPRYPVNDALARPLPLRRNPCTTQREQSGHDTSVITQRCRAADTKDQTMTTIPDSQVGENLREDTTSEPDGDQSEPHWRRGFPVPQGTLAWASIVVAATAVVALAFFAFTGRDEPAAPTPDPDLVTTPTEYPPNYYPHGYDYGEAQEAEDDSSDDAFVPGSRHIPGRGTIRSASRSFACG
jgi:hypothetical protein